MQSKLTAVVNTLNEELHLEECLASLKGVADEIVVVDMHSDDRTVAIARRFTDRVFTHERTGYVEPAREFAIRQATGDWILVIDADERLSPALARSLRSLIHEQAPAAYALPFRTFIAGRWLKGTGWERGREHHMRLFRAGAVEWPTHVHAVPIVNGETRRVDLGEDATIDHVAFATLSEFIQRTDRYTEGEARILEERGAVWSPEEAARAMRAEWLERYHPDRDGAHSFVLAGFMAFYRFLAWAKLWERNGFPQPALPADAQAVLDLFANPDAAVAMKTPFPVEARFGKGFHQDESGWRWMSREAELHLPAAIAATHASVSLELAAESAKFYGDAPVTLRAAIDGQEVGRSRAPGVLDVPLPRDRGPVLIRLQADRWFIPSQVKESIDERELSVRLRLSLRARP